MKPTTPLDTFPAGTADAMAACRFDVPDLPRNHVARTRALHLLAEADQVPLVVVGGPAGTGKTTLVAEWVKAEGRAGDAAWVTFEARATDSRGPDVFWACLVRCLTELGVEVPAPGSSTPGWLRALASAVTCAGRRLTVVLDNHHLVPADVAEDVGLLLRLTNGSLRLVFCGRGAPALPLYRYRLAGTVVELGFRELAFDDREAAALLSEPGEPPRQAVVGEVNDYHGGWAAGLVLSGLPSRGDATGESTAQDAGGDLGDIDDYVRREVLDPLPAQARRFLLGTCVTERFDSELALDLAGVEAEDLVRLAETRAFALPAGDGHRFPGVFRDVLRRQLTHSDASLQKDVRTKAGRWLHRHGEPVEALRQFAKAGAWEEASALLIDEQLVARLLQEGQGGELHALCATLPPTASRAGPVVRAALRLTDGDAAGCADALAGVMADLTAGDPALRSCVAALDAVRARLADDADNALASAEAAWRVLGESTTVHSARSLPALVHLARGVALLRHGSFDLARAVFEEPAPPLGTRHPAVVHADRLAHLALTDALEGYLARAEQAATEALALSAPQSPFGAHAAARVALGLVALDRCDPEAARRHAIAAGPAREPLTRYLVQQVIAGVEAAEGHPTAAASRLHAVLAQATVTDPWTAGHLRVEIARIALIEGNPGLALNELGPLDGPRCGAHPEAAAVRAAAFTRRDEDSRAQRALADVTESYSPLRPRVEALLVEAERRLRHHSPSRAATALDASLRLAEPERLRLPFRQAEPDVRHLLANDSLRHRRWLGGTGGANGAGPVEALTAREREVLGHLTDLLTTEEIAEAMVVSVNTVRTHVRGILRKLGVNRRYAAVRRARELGLLDE
ncbi:LuxR C-terminal-related transcriptional regulator [Saccharomonospora xinjiangensis]|uniref:LuxR C-terminal-related transcriptional regulator n=1 Tax=Saccharomonospora xinjiangensis TaxID=75294 RepID=UPI00106F9226|nr:LuxR C-terminal-related transcriptional regulator [Saccharomonospora xinjiangensis]QBQ58581.1 Serine/threonine-protein kinase PknK [Saccharomonospora xinjiangensis]